MIYTVTLNPAVDRSVIINDFAAGKVNRIVSTHDDPGGKGINVSKIVHSLGGNTVAMGIIGGNTGAFIKNSIHACGIETDFVETDLDTRVNMKISDPVNHVTTDINAAGAPLSKELTDKVLHKLMSRLKMGDTVVLAGKMDTSALDISDWINRIQLAGAKTFLDTEGTALDEGIKAAPYLIKPNVMELSKLLGADLSKIDELTEAAISLIKKYGIKTVIISRGADGAICVTNDIAITGNGIRVKEVCTTGAGDTMLGAFAYAVESDMKIEEAFSLSIAASAAAVTCPGTQCPSNDDIELLRKQVMIRIL